MTIVRRFTIIFLALFLTGFYFGPKVTAGFLNPASEDDPLITKKWVDGYIYEKFSSLHNQALALEQTIQALDASVEQIKDQARPTIILTIGSQTGWVGQEEKRLDVAPLLVSGRILLPLRFVGEALGVDFAWDQQSKTVTYLSRAGEVVLTMGQNHAQVGSESVALDVPGRVTEGRILVPLRFIGESLDAKVIWHGETKSAEIR
ncbi:copper amine oxidase N-terminal domain-containing protein [Candidatus Formimonas warabiya]|uniref:copper amine oxidase N-terminal domain-containing protein n=1 Tax=Formimonas warabiya TaxID=1761012 RepID=UPI001BE49CE5|nr:copper amine oxidase N-terminal domain-containing protein [Candidatus Formimonas warabiya]